jgi:hypothetical protein
MAIKSFEVINYTLQAGFKNTASSPVGTILIQGLLVCNGADGTRFAIYGLHPLSPVPAPVYNEATKWGNIFIPFKELREYVDIVRNEKPVYAYLNSANPDWNSISTSTEPVGEGE